MAATAADIASLRRMVADTGTPSEYSDDDLRACIERYPLPDAAGRQPGVAGWVATYDLHAAAADIWQQKAGALAGCYDFDADGARFARSQAYEHALTMARHYRARRAARAVSVSEGAGNADL